MTQKNIFTFVNVLIIGGLLLTGCKPFTTQPTGLPQGAGNEWHLVVIGESSSWGLGEAYASQIEKDLGIKVILDDFAIGDLRAIAVLEALRTGKSSNSRLEQLPAALKQADMVVMSASPYGSVTPETRKSIERCFSSLEPAPCTPQGLEGFTADLQAIWAIIFELREGRPTILRGIDAASPFVSSWKKYQVYDACTVCWEEYSEASRRAAEAYHIPFLSRYDAFNGLEHDEDLSQKGYAGSDGIHPNDLASQLTAELLSKLGYEPVPPP